ncbi:hypothetical protein DBR40_08760 [Pedobacter sp. KBW01]|uniref:lantibiotic dehydratase n=1 Tax=Pedobacter sp. KBW01 TaxID=2153364 RepID=UPI000F58FC20|nr:lantibiotic dehydratase [Pedobacter sp. KBW01]RQO78034.1 hypothetical protein DBR40_08760 [Pedobacter sp. KBW01]
MSLHIFPHSLVRYAGLHHQLFDQFKYTGTESILAAYKKLNDEKEQLKNHFCEALYPIIAEQQDDKLRQQLINVKRQVFNDKELSDEHFLAINRILPDTLSLVLKGYLDKVKELALFQTQNAMKFEEQQNLQRQYLQEVCLKPALQNGLLLSSPLLYSQLNHFIKKDTTSFKQKEHRVMFSLLRYLTRIAYKTSPFSSFTYTGLMELGAPLPTETSKQAHKIGSRLKLNNALFEYLKAVSKKHSLLNEHLLIKLNITAEIKTDKICFLINFNNIESFQQLNANGLQLMVYQYLNNHKGAVSLKNLICYLAGQLQNQEDESMKNYLLRLVEAGLLEMDLGFSGMDQHWDQKLLFFLSSLKEDEPSVLPIIKLFEKLQAYRDDYELAGSTERYQLLQDAEQELNSVFAGLQQEAGLPFYITMASEKEKQQEIIPADVFSNNKFVPYYFSARHIFYEDCYTTEKTRFSEQKVKDFVAKTDELTGHLLPLDVMQKERIKMREFFLQHYQNGDAIALTTFYRDYFFYCKKPEKEAGASEETDLLLLKHWKEAVQAKLALMDHTDHLIAFDCLFFNDLPQGNDLAKKSSSGMFVQFTENDGELLGVINALLPGMGKVSGRFLSLFDEEITRQFVQYNERLHPDQIKVELNDASTFNANIHPPLLAHELELPGGNNIYQEDKQFNISRLKVKYNQRLGILTLHNQDSELYSYDLSLESFYNRSNLYQLLAHFNPDARLSLQPFIQLVDLYCQGKLSAPVPDIFTLPRIVYARNVVIRRKTWRIKTGIIPVHEQLESDFEYFIKLNSWLKAHEIPQQIFLFLRKRAYLSSKDEKRAGLYDDYKPQYLCFDSPLLVGMFKKLLLRAGDYLTFEEVFPKPDQHAVREYLIQWYNT